MNFDILEVLSYTVVVITVLTMVFGVIAYYFYKLRESRRKRDNANQGSGEPKEKDKYLYFEEKELL
jgi:heme/copper-type cytochrome/quinol oxidase subunit 2